MRYEIKKLIYLLLFCIVTLTIAYTITSLLDIQNIILFESSSASGFIITYEVLIWYTLSFLESGIFELYKRKKQET